MVIRYLNDSLSAEQLLSRPVIDKSMSLRNSLYNVLLFSSSAKWSRVNAVISSLYELNYILNEIV